MDLSIKIINHITEDIGSTAKVGIISAITGASLGTLRTVVDYHNVMNNLKRIKKDCLGDKDCEEKVDIVMEKVKQKALKGGIIGAIGSGIATGTAGVGLSALADKISGR